MTRLKAFREIFITALTLLAVYNAGRSIADSIERQLFLHKETIALRNGQVQAQQVNKELREGLQNYSSSTGIERLARERLNLAGPDEIIVRIGK